MSTLSHTVKLLHGRDADGFVEGSQEQRDFRRLMRGQRTHGDVRRIEARKRYYHNRERHLICPEVVTKEAQLRARRAARALGVECPDWADGWGEYR
jgi:hypothetical protein